MWVKEGIATHYIGLDIFHRHISEFIRIAKENMEINFLIRPHDRTHIWDEVFRKELKGVENIKISRAGNLDDILLNSVDVVAGYTSTSLIEALIYGIPTISIDTGEYYNIFPIWEHGLSIRAVSLKDMEDHIKRLLYIPEEKEKAVKSMCGNISVFNYNNDGMASRRIAGEFNKLLSS